MFDEECFVVRFNFSKLLVTFDGLGRKNLVVELFFRNQHGSRVTLCKWLYAVPKAEVFLRTTPLRCINDIKYCLIKHSIN
jgi:hypothetical protein